MADINYTALPTIKRFHQSNALIRGIKGPEGSGKTVGCCFEICRLACLQKPYKGVRYVKFAMIRNTYDQLIRTTMQTWIDWFGDFSDIHLSSPISARMKIPSFLNDGTDIDVWLEFLSLDKPDDVKKIKSLEVTGSFLNEASEMGRWVVTRCFARRGRYPKPDWGGATWAGLIMDTNSCDDDHWWYKASEEENNQGWEFFDQPPALLKFVQSRGKTAQEALDEFWVHNPLFPKELKKKVVRDMLGNLYIANPLAENAKNLKLGYDYWLDTVPGRPIDEISVLVLNEYGTVTDSKPVYPEYIDSIHCAKEDLKAVQDIGITLGFDFGRCYSDDTEVLTKEGWKFFKDVNEKKDFVATRNPKNGKFEYTPINFKVVYDYKGDMYQWSNFNIDFCVTPEHVIPFNFRDTPNKVHFKDANWLLENSSGHHYVDLTSKWCPNYRKKMILGMDPKLFSRFMGLYLSEGCFDKNYNRVSIFQKKSSKYFNYFKIILSKTGFDWKRDKGCWRVSSSKLKNYLKKFGHAKEKYIPEDIKNMPKELIKAFIYSYTFGDGHIRKRKRYIKNGKKFGGSTEHTIFTSSKRMADDLQELAQKVGWNSSICNIKPQKSIIVENGNKRIINGSGGYSITFKKKAKRAELLKNNFKRIKYNGKIYCLNVPYHTLYIRRNGRPSWNGNTPACTISQISAIGQKKVLEEHLVKEHGSMGIRSFSREILVPHLLENFLPWLRAGIVKSYGDPAGKGREQTDEKTCFMLLNECPVTNPNGGLPNYKKNAERLKDDRWVEKLKMLAKNGMVSLGDLGVQSRPARTNSFEARRDAVARLLMERIDGEPAILISPSLKYLRKGMRGKYMYKRVQVSGEARYKDEPFKNIFSHINEALMYDCLESCFMVTDTTEEDRKKEQQLREEIGNVGCVAWDELRQIREQIEEGEYYAEEYY